MATIEIIGLIAAALTTSSFIPQVYSCQIEIRENQGRAFFSYQGKIFRHSLSYGDKF